ncbi:MAG TPA: PIN domain-containing protein [Acidimicrobiales bacterium]|nr:PIN domain-containing protein [Acidimicrobiales bacterium]
MIVALDAEAVNALAGPNTPAYRRVRETLEGAERTRSDVLVPTLVLAELYRGRARSQAVDALLARHEDSIATRDTDRALARFVGAALHAAGLGSEHIVDAHVVATVAEGGGGAAVTGDLDDLTKLAAPYRSVVVEPV